MAAQKLNMVRTKVAMEFSNAEEICDLKLKMVATKASFFQGRVMDEVEMREENSICCTLVRTYAMERSREISCVLQGTLCLFTWFSEILEHVCKLIGMIQQR